MIEAKTGSTLLYFIILCLLFQCQTTDYSTQYKLKRVILFTNNGMFDNSCSNLKCYFLLEIESDSQSFMPDSTSSYLLVKNYKCAPFLLHDCKILGYKDSIFCRFHNLEYNYYGSAISKGSKNAFYIMEGFPTGNSISEIVTNYMCLWKDTGQFFFIDRKVNHKIDLAEDLGVEVYFKNREITNDSLQINRLFIPDSTPD